MIIGGMILFDALNRIKELREARGRSVYHMAKLSGIPQSTIATWYQKNLCPPIDKIETLCDTFGISLPEFFSAGDSDSLPEEISELTRLWMLLDSDKKHLVLALLNALSLKNKQ